LLQQLQDYQLQMPILERELEYKDHEIAQYEKFRYDVSDLKN